MRIACGPSRAFWYQLHVRQKSCSDHDSISMVLRICDSAEPATVPIDASISLGIDNESCAGLPSTSATLSSTSRPEAERSRRRPRCWADRKPTPLRSRAIPLPSGLPRSRHAPDRGVEGAHELFLPSRLARADDQQALRVVLHAEP